MTKPEVRLPNGPDASTDRIAAPPVTVSRAQRVANQIEHDIRHNNTAPETVLGTREELARRYDVSPVILQQSARILQERGIAYLRPGNRGGLVVLSQTSDAVARALATFLEFSAVTFEDVAEVADGIFGLAVEKGLRSINLRTADRLRVLLIETENDQDDLELAQKYMELRLALTDCVSNPLLSLVHRTLACFLTDLTRFELRSQADRAAHHAFQKQNLGDLISAVIGGDALAALHAFRENLRFLRLEGGHLRDRREAFSREVRLYSVDLAGPDRRPLRAEHVVREILREIRLLGWPTGERLGSEAEMLRRYGVSRATMRHAVRMLEEYSAVKMQRGPGGGLIITSPDARRVVAMAAAYLSAANISKRQLSDVLEMLALRALCRVHDKANKELLDKLAASVRRVLDRSDQDLPRTMHEVFLVIAGLAGNRLIELVIQLIAEVYPPSPNAGGVGENASVALHDALEALVSSLQCSDLARARRALIDSVNIAYASP